MSENTKTPETPKLTRNATIYELSIEERIVMKALTDAGLVVSIGEHAQLKQVAQELYQERNVLRTVLQRYMAAYPAFRMKPIGAEGSPARIEQENLMALEEAAKAALSAPEGGR